jgi:hypothetical protein
MCEVLSVSAAALYARHRLELGSCRACPLCTCTYPVMYDHVSHD